MSIESKSVPNDKTAATRRVVAGDADPLLPSTTASLPPKVKQPFAAIDPPRPVKRNRPPTGTISHVPSAEETIGLSQSINQYKNRGETGDGGAIKKDVFPPLVNYISNDDLMFKRPPVRMQTSFSHNNQMQDEEMLR